jgi:acyl carrier protein
LALRSGSIGGGVDVRRRAAQRQRLCADIRELLVEALDLPVDPAWITDDQPLFGRGLELDSMDSVELAVVVEDRFGVTVTDDDIGALATVNSLADFIEAKTGP